MNPTYAVIIGINYRKNPFMATLDTAVFDAARVAEYALTKYKIPPHNIRFLSDVRPDKLDPRLGVYPATRGSIVRSCAWLVAHQDAPLFFFYAGHGYQRRRRAFCGPDDCTELDHRSELIAPSNSTSWFRPLLDKDLYTMLVKPLTGSSLYAVLDCCNSSTLLQLPTLYNPRLRRWQINTKCPKTEDPPKVVCLSASEDDQNAYENVDKQPGGVFTNAWLKYDNISSPKQTLHKIHAKLHHTQTPTLTMSGLAR